MSKGNTWLKTRGKLRNYESKLKHFFSLKDK